MRIGESVPEQISSSAAHGSEGELVPEQVSPSIVYDSDDDYGGASEDDNRDGHHLRMTDVPVAGDDHQDVPVTENDCQDALVTDDGHQDVLVADNDHQDVPVTGDSHQEQSPPVAFPMVDSDACRYPRRSHQPPQRYADYVAH